MRERRQERGWSCELSEDIEVKVWMHRGSVLSLFLFEVVVDVVAELA